jgi:hypothetical protein
VWYNCSLHLFLQFLVPIHEVIHYLVKFLTSTGSGWCLSTMMSKSSSSCSSLSVVSSLTQRCDNHEFYGYLIPPNLGTLVLEIQGQTWGCSLFCPVFWGPSKHRGSNRNDCKNCRQTSLSHWPYPLHTCFYWPKITVYAATPQIINDMYE